MHKKVLIFIGLIFLAIFLFIGTPFEFLNPITDTIGTFSIIILFIFLFIFLFKQIRKLENKTLKLLGFGILTILFVPYFIIGFYTALLSWSIDHPMWKDLRIYTNSQNDKVISQWRETSGSLYDSRDRKIIAEFGQFRISFNYDIKNLKGVWAEYDIEKDKTTKMNFDK